MRTSFFLILVILWIPAQAQNSDSAIEKTGKSIGLSVKEQDASLDENIDFNPINSRSESSQGLPFRKDSVIPPKSLARVTIAVLIGLGLAITAVYFLKKYLFARNHMGSGSHRMQLLEVKRLSPRLILFMVEIDKKTVVLAQSGEQLVTLDPNKALEIQVESGSNEN
jgi:flagellar biogenesis protein FliO